MFQTKRFFDWKINRFFINFWLVISCILSELYYDNKRWIIDKIFRGNGKLSSLKYQTLSPLINIAK